MSLLMNRMKCNVHNDIAFAGFLVGTTQSSQTPTLVLKLGLSTENLVQAGLEDSPADLFATTERPHALLGRLLDFAVELQI